MLQAEKYKTGDAFAALIDRAINATGLSLMFGEIKETEKGFLLSR